MSSPSRWTHAICASCWNERNPGRQAMIVVEALPETCCFCGSPTSAGIYVREAPERAPHCKGHDDKRGGP